MNDSTKKVPLKLIVSAVEMASDEWNQYLDTETTEIISIPQFDSYLYEDYAELAEQIEDDIHHRYLGLPDKYDIHEYRIMERFVYSLPSGSIQDELERAIRGSGAFRRFKSTVRYHGIKQAWYDYRDEAFRDIAINWCEVNGFEYYDDFEEAEI